MYDAPTKLQITAYADDSFTDQAIIPGNPFSVWVNPGSYTYKRNARYGDRQAQGASGPSPQFNRIAEEEVSFELLFDATGVVPPVWGPSTYDKGVATGIAQLTALISNVNGTIHSPNYLILSWAQLQFRCVLVSMSVNYTLFRPDGTPLRAKVALNFESFTDETALAKEAGEESPDVTHLVTVAAGDTLPLLCYRIYGDSRYYMKVAAFNDLPGFRALAPGEQLVFPPLSGSS